MQKPQLIPLTSLSIMLVLSSSVTVHRVLSLLVYMHCICGISPYNWSSGMCLECWSAIKASGRCQFKPLTHKCTEGSSRTCYRLGFRLSFLSPSPSFESWPLQHTLQTHAWMNCKTTRSLFTCHDVRSKKKIFIKNECPCWVLMVLREQTSQSCAKTKYLCFKSNSARGRTQTK